MVASQACLVGVAFVAHGRQVERADARQVGGITDVDDKWKGIGIRIENDILITEDGFENLTSKVPVETDDIENLMKS